MSLRQEMDAFPDSASMADPDIMDYDESHKTRLNLVERQGIDGLDA